MFSGKDGAYSYNGITLRAPSHLCGIFNYNTLCRYRKGYFTVYCHAEYRYAVSGHAECNFNCVVMLSVTNLSAIMLSVCGQYKKLHSNLPSVILSNIRLG
jgi:hypothetical protein